PQYYPPQGGGYPPQGSGGYAVPAKKKSHGVQTAAERSKEQQMLVETEGLRRRVRRDTEAAFDPKCNSELLKEIILENMNATTAVAKRQIQEAATERLGGRIDVVCSTGTFSYIVNTELYCETEKDGTTCFAFRQSS
ncbi:ground-like domain protein, partial [Cooperia oncophora]